MFQDEGRFGRINDPRRCSAPCGVRPDVPQQIVREYTYAFAAISPHDGTLDSLILPEVNTKMMSLFLEEVSFRHPDEFIMMFMDQAGWHKAGGLKVPDNIASIACRPTVLNAILLSIFGRKFAKNGLRIRCLTALVQWKMYWLLPWLILKRTRKKYSDYQL